MASIQKVYLGSKQIETIYLGEEIVTMGIGSDATSGGIFTPDLPSIPNPVASMVPKIPNSNLKSTTSQGLAVLGQLGLDSSILTATIEIPCDGGFPTKADIVNEFNKIAQIPGKLKQALIEKAEDLTEDVVADIRALIKDVEELVKKIEDLLSPYWEKGKIRNWQKEAKDAWDELIQEFHIFIPVKMLEMISKLIPIDFNINILGIEINLLKIFTEEEQTRIKTEIIKKIPKLPDPYDRMFNGEFGVVCDEWRAKYTWQYIKNEIIQWCTNALFKAFEALIKKFKKIWKALGLPAIPDILSFDIDAWMKELIDRLKEEALAKVRAIQEELEGYLQQAEQFAEDVQEKITKLQEDIKNFSVTGYIISELEQVEIFGKKLIDIIGGPIDENVKTGEEIIADLMRQAKEWFAQWQKELFMMWVRKIKKFLKKIGLDKLLELLTLDFCDVLKLIGIPTTFTFSV